MALMVSVSGIRGIVGESLTMDVLLNFLKAYISVINESSKNKIIVIGRDSRPTGEMIEQFVSSTLQGLGYSVINLGIATTPTVEVAVTNLNADGGIIITASHNPVEWNALKFLNNKGEFFNEETVEKLKSYLNKEVSYKRYDEIGKSSVSNDGNKIHIKNVLDLPYINIDKIKEKNFKVALDTVNGAGVGIVRELSKELNFDLVEVNCEPHGFFQRGAEPTPENLTDLSKLVVENGCDIGFALDPDGDRLAIVDENGRPIGEEYTLAVACDFLLSVKKGTITTNLSSSMVLDDIAKKYGETCQRSKVGEINVSMKMQQNGSVIGGEGNGGVILPDSHYGRDAIVGIVLVLQSLAENTLKISQIRDSFTDYFMLKEKKSIEGLDKEAIFKKCVEKYKEFKIDSQDGIKIVTNEWWIHVRASNTEPIIRIMIESASLELNTKLYNEFIEKIFS